MMVTMKYPFLLFVCVLGFVSSITSTNNGLEGTDDGSETWGYVEVRPRAHMFWWLYWSPNRVDDPSKPWPTILWLQGGPGGSGVGFGNFGEIGPLDVNLKPRNSTWLQKADILFVDSPVGTGFSYVEDDNLFVTTDIEAATDLTTLLKTIYNISPSRQKSVALGDSWISPEDFVLSWGPLLKDVSRMDDVGLNKSNSLALNIQQQLADGQYEAATGTWSKLEDVISASSNDVDFYNFMLDDGNDPFVMKTKAWGRLGKQRHAKADDAVDLDSVMNGPIRQKLKIIPANVT
ncbi:Peptidase S10, serine carboxypeptidase [Cynara cardunculus var. scolymus]|uniref:Peptidase S10, serine carboxypeptidase n=1 Tax=Cynara cardunculus var. scolymus TaxID=59895 RepID=A0A103YF75_CYNCS|nr:Peptidase S10, serine carboxypeptidase [Cynara cardunculus var. scolymus]